MNLEEHEHEVELWERTERAYLMGVEDTLWMMGEEMSQIVEGHKKAELKQALKNLIEKTNQASLDTKIFREASFSQIPKL